MWSFEQVLPWYIRQGSPEKQNQWKVCVSICMCVLHIHTHVEIYCKGLDNMIIEEGKFQDLQSDEQAEPIV